MHAAASDRGLGWRVELCKDLGEWLKCRKGYQLLFSGSYYTLLYAYIIIPVAFCFLSRQLMLQKQTILGPGKKKLS